MKRKAGLKNCSRGANCGDTCISRADNCPIAKGDPRVKAAANKIKAKKEPKVSAAAKAVAARIQAEKLNVPVPDKPVTSKAKEPKAPAKVKTEKPKVATAASKLKVEKPKDSKPGELLGRGAFGSVTLNKDGTVTKTFNRSVSEESLKNELAFQNVAAKAGLAPKLVSYGTNSFIMERAQGKVASDYDTETRRLIAFKTIEALKELHKLGVAHNDVHAGNVFYDEKTGKVQLIDFGMASNKKKDIAAEQNFEPIFLMFS